MRPACADRLSAPHWTQDRLPEPVVETFTATVLRFDSDAVEGTVSFAASARETANSGLPLLEQAEDAGLTPDYGCRMGICNTCSRRKLSGTVRNVFTGALSTATDEQIRICATVPARRCRARPMSSCST